ncbi:uncharacterized protein LOC143804035 [Ranitomeya variabilis]|uniref:uncharacterized protein LOC143804035 n=1 Tax=Ranitomeya variabilis TaxID=490064 RepID=UPI004055CC7D
MENVSRQFINVSDELPSTMTSSSSEASVTQWIEEIRSWSPMLSEEEEEEGEAKDQKEKPSDTEKMIGSEYKVTLVSKCSVQGAICDKEEKEEDQEQDEVVMYVERFNDMIRTTGAVAMYTKVYELKQFIISSLLHEKPFPLGLVQPDKYEDIFSHFSDCSTLDNLFKNISEWTPDTIFSGEDNEESMEKNREVLKQRGWTRRWMKHVRHPPRQNPPRNPTV